MRNKTLFHACARGEVEEVRRTFAQGRRGWERKGGREGTCAPERGTSLDGHLEVAEVPLSVAGIRVNSADGDGRTPLWLACMGNHAEVAKMG